MHGQPFPSLLRAQGFCKANNLLTAYFKAEQHPTAINCPFFYLVVRPTDVEGLSCDIFRPGFQKSQKLTNGRTIRKGKNMCHIHCTCFCSQTFNGIYTRQWVISIKYTSNFSPSFAELDDLRVLRNSLFTWFSITAGKSYAIVVLPGSGSFPWRTIWTLVPLHHRESAI